MKNYIRIDIWLVFGKSRVRVCPHISINAKKISDKIGDWAEYEQNLDIYCSVCKKTYRFNVAVG